MTSSRQGVVLTPDNQTVKQNVNCMTTLDAPGAPQTSAPFWNNVLRYGGFCALALVGLSLLWYLLGLNMMNMGNMALQFLCLFAATIAFSIIAIRAQRDQLEGGYISFGRAFFIGLLVTVFAVFLSSFWNYILMNFIDPGYVDTLKENFQEAWGESMPAEAMEQTMEKFDESAELGTNIINGLTGGVIFGAISGLIAGGIMRRNPPTA